MVFTIVPVKSADIPALTTIQWAALQNNPLIRTLYPRGYTPALGAFTTTSYQRAHRFNSVRLIKAIDPTTGEIVAFAKWIIYRKYHQERELGMMNREPHPADFDDPEEDEREIETHGWRKSRHRATTEPPDCYTKALEDWNDLMSKTRRGIMHNRRHTCPSDPSHTLSCYFSSYAPDLWVLDILHTLPAHQGRGAGAQLVKWGTDMADAEGLSCYLESSPAALSLFTFCGFDDITEMGMDLGKYRAGQPEYKHVVMLRPPYGFRHVSVRPPPQVSPKSHDRLTLNLMDEDPDWVDTISEETGEYYDGVDINELPPPNPSSAAAAPGTNGATSTTRLIPPISTSTRTSIPTSTSTSIPTKRNYLELPMLEEARLLQLHSSSSTGSPRLRSVSHTRSNSSKEIRPSSSLQEIRETRSSVSLR